MSLKKFADPPIYIVNALNGDVPMTIEDSPSRPTISDSFGLGTLTRRDFRQRELQERLSRGEYWVDLDFLAGLLVDSRALAGRDKRQRRV